MQNSLNIAQFSISKSKTSLVTYRHPWPQYHVMSYYLARLFPLHHSKEALLSRVNYQAVL